MTEQITDLDVIIGGRGTEVPSGFHKIPVDCNKGAGGDYIYICYKRDAGPPPSQA